jgi:serine/threonine protein kinase
VAEDLDLYCLADPVEFRHPGEWAPAWSVDLAGSAPDPGWSVHETPFWVIHRPAPAGERGALAEAGWKIHVSAVEEHALDTLERVRAVCVRERIVFKHLRSTALLVAMGSKGAPRSGSGKFITVYPRDDAHTVRLADELSASLRGRPGPRVLTDVLWDDDAPVSVRHGAFTSRWTWTEDGRRVPAAARDGVLVPDLRSIPHAVPAGAVPEAIGDRMRRRATDALPFRVDAAIQFSNCGGVYRAEPLATDGGDRGRVVLKEARPHTGSGPSLVPAVERLRAEAGWLRRLDGVPGVPRLRDELTVGGHRFVAVEELPGMDLRTWVATHHPALGPGASAEELAAYADRCRRILDGLRDVVDRIHGAGVAHRDLHPGNVLVDEDLGASVIDLELAAEAGDTSAPTLGCPGFLVEEGAAAERDRHAVAVIGLWTLSPTIGGGVELDPALLDRHVDDVRALFGRHAEWALADADAVGSRMRRRAPGPAAGSPASAPVAHATQSRMRDWLAASARSDAAPLFPVDPRGMSTPLAELGLAHGASGVLAALAADGGGSLLLAEREAARRGVRVPDDDPGLWEGWSGVAAAAALRGDLELAGHAGRRAADAAAACTALDLAGGLAGVVSMLLAVAAAQPDPADAEAWRSRAVATALRIPPALDGPAAPDTAGLEDGHGGIAVVLAQAASHADGADARALLAGLRACRARDLSRCEEVRPGVMVVRRGRLHLPYLGRGALGAAVARSRTAVLVGEPAVDDAVRALATSALIDLVVDGGIVAGRSGLALGLAQLARVAEEEDAPDAALTWSSWSARHLARMDRHLVRTDRGIAALGRGGARVSADLATGTAGVLTTMSAVHAPDGPAWRLLDALVGGALTNPDRVADAHRPLRTEATAPHDRRPVRDAGPANPERG